VQQVVDRRFNRARDAADQTMAAFATRFRHAVDLDSVRDDLAGVAPVPGTRPRIGVDQPARLSWLPPNWAALSQISHRLTGRQRTRPDRLDIQWTLT
jgi:hypothetical protein